MIHYNTPRKVIDLDNFRNVRLIENELFDKVDFVYLGSDYPKFDFTFSNCEFRDVTISGQFMSFINYRDCKFSTFKYKKVNYVDGQFSNCTINRQIFDFECGGFSSDFWKCTFNECISFGNLDNSELRISHAIIKECIFERGIYFYGKVKVLDEQFLLNLKKNNIWIGNKRDEIDKYKIINGYVCF